MANAPVSLKIVNTVTLIGEMYIFFEIEPIHCLSALQAISLVIFKDTGWRDLGNLEKLELDMLHFRELLAVLFSSW